MNKIVRFFFLACLFIGLISPALAAQPTKESLLTAWETIQKNDPDTVTFEKLAENHYRYKTNRLPFDGELKILNLIIEDRESGYDENIVWGVVELELLNIPDDFPSKHPYSYSRWQQNNTLLFNNDTQKWLTTNAYFAKQKIKLNPGGNTLDLITWIIPIVLFGFLLLLFSNMSKLRKKNEINVQKSFGMAEETNRLLKEILEELRKK